MINIKAIMQTLGRKLKYNICYEGGIYDYEILYSQIWHSISCGMKWLNNMEDMSLFPGRWAIGYNTMYVLARVLNDTTPHNVLEFGLGNSSKIVSKYFAYWNENEWSHIIIEHNKDWIEFISKEKLLLSNSKIFQSELIEKKYRRKPIIAYKDISSVMNLKYDLIIIDGPLGSNGVYSRMDLIEYLPECLSESFVIIIDDYNRKGEKGLVHEIEKCLLQNNIEYASGLYLGETECFLISSKNNAFLTSL